jgi:nucleoside-diphosphate-sugar epimerase
LIDALSQNSTHKIIALDVNDIDEQKASKCSAVIKGDIYHDATIARVEKYNISKVFHLAALLSSRAEKDPNYAHLINVGGTRKLIDMAHRIGKREKSPVRFLFPSSIAVYGIKSVKEKDKAGAITEDSFVEPITMYGLNKMYCEHLGRYFTKHYKLLEDDSERGHVDFRAIRFPGIISAFTVPSGGTSDYASEMIHSAAQKKPYTCFVRPDTKIPFMAMPDAVRSLLELSDASPKKLTRTVYNIGAFAETAEDIAKKVKSAFPESEITYESHPKRQEIVDSWCADVDDSAAKNDWGWEPKYGFKEAFNFYLIPNISKYYTYKSMIPNIVDEYKNDKK